MKNAPKVSVIIPVYNVERYLEECLDSAVSQTLKDIEIICVNDGSTDGSRAILERYAQRDPRITVIDKENGGPSSARNTALDAVSGEYIIFLDSDDFQERNLLELCCEKADAFSLDIVIFDAQSFFENDELKERFAVYDGLYVRKGGYDGISDGLSLFGELRSHGDYREPPYLSLYRRSFLKEKGSFHFIEGIIHEDDVFTFSTLLKANRVEHIPQTLYHRRIRNDSLMTDAKSTAKSSRSFWGKSIGQIALTTFLAENHIDPASNPAIADYLEERRQHILALFSEVWEAFTDNEAARFFDQTVEKLGAIEAVTILAQRFWDDKRKAAAKLGDSVAILCTRNTIRTIAMFYHRFHNGGTERVMAHLTDLFSEMGYKVVLFTNQESSGDDYPTTHPYDRVVLPTPEQGFEYRLRAEVLLEALKSHDVDLFIYHAWIYEIALWDALVIKSLGISFLMYTHNPWASKTLDTTSSYRFEMPSIYALFDGVVSLTRCDWLYWSCFNSNARLVFNPAPFKPPILDGFDRTPDELVWVGRLAREKNYEDVLGIMELVVRERPQAHLTIVGKGENDEIDRAFQEAIDARGLSEAITLASYHRDVSLFYRSAAVFLLTSLYEGFCYTLLESKGYALPCVAYDLPYLELFREGKGLLAVPQGDSVQMARAIVDLLDNRSLLQKMGEDARKDFLSYCERDLLAAWQGIIDGSIQPVPGGYRFVDPDADETLRLLCETELFFTELALQRVRDERIVGYEATIQDEHSQLEEILHSKSFRVGNALMIIPRKIRGFLRRLLKGHDATT